MQIELPISKSIANRWLMLQAIHGDELMPVSYSMPNDVRMMSKAIRLLGERRELRIDIGNCGTAMRFLTAYCAQLEGQTTILDGVERMHHRPFSDTAQCSPSPSPGSENRLTVACMPHTQRGT